MKWLAQSILFSALLLSLHTTWAAVYRASDPFDMGAALANNATTEIYNPAGLTNLENVQIVGSYVWFEQSIEYNGTVTEVPLQKTQYGNASTTFSSSLPGLFLSVPVTDDLVLGFSYSTPYGSPNGPKYAEDAIVGYSYTELLLNTYNYSGALGYKLTEKWSIGAGLNYQTMNVDFRNVLLANQFPVGFTNSADGHAWWWHAGILYAPTQTTRLGFTYWSTIHQKLYGSSEISGVINKYSDNLKIDLTIPPSYMFSIFQILNEQWGINLTVGYTPWSELSNLALENSAAGTLVTEGVYNNTWRATIGPGFKLNDKWSFDGFVRYEQLAINDDIRLPSQPGDVNWSLGIGAAYNFTDKISLKTRYIYPFYDVKDLDATTQANRILYQGQEERSANVLGAQLIWSL